MFFLPAKAGAGLKKGTLIRSAEALGYYQNVRYADKPTILFHAFSVKTLIP